MAVEIKRGGGVGVWVGRLYVVGLLGGRTCLSTHLTWWWRVRAWVLQFRLISRPPGTWLGENIRDDSIRLLPIVKQQVGGGGRTILLVVSSRQAGYPLVGGFGWAWRCWGPERWFSFEACGKESGGRTARAKRVEPRGVLGGCRSVVCGGNLAVLIHLQPLRYLA